MPRCRFVDPTRERRLWLSDGDWISVRDELSVGQVRDLTRSLRRPGESTPDYAGYPVARALAYLTRWSLVDAQGAPAPITAGALECLEVSTFTEITAAIDAHEAARDEEKKRTTTPAIDSDRILQSVG